MSKETVQHILRVCRWLLLALCVAYVLLVLIRIPVLNEKEKTKAAVARIEAQRVTPNDVLGQAPSVPNATQNSATLAGIDLNNNGIRDDVEAVIFAMYPHSARTRAAELQYVLAKQLFLTGVTNKETWEAAATQEDRAYQCLGKVFDQGQDRSELVIAVEAETATLKRLIFNTQARREAFERNMKFITGFGLKDNVVCDIDLDTLPN